MSIVAGRKEIKTLAEQIKEREGKNEKKRQVL